MPCVIAFDELERLTDRDAMEVVNFLVKHSPACLRIVMSGREVPVGLDIAQLVLEGDSSVLTSRDLRFSRPEIARFFDLKLTRRELSAVAANSGGWPIALCIQRNSGGLEAEAHVVRDIVESWLDSRFWRGFRDEDLELVLDVGLLEWIDAELLDEVFDEQASMWRLEHMAPLEGMFEYVHDGSRKVWRLHPLVRHHCVNKRRRETPDRYRTVHRRIAQVLARRGETLLAVRHASEGSDPRLVGQILTEAGSVRLWLLEGVDGLVAMDRLVSDETIATHASLAMMRCIALSYLGRFEEGRQVFDEANARLGDELPDRELEVNRCLAKAMLCHNGCDSVGSRDFQDVLEGCARLAGEPDVDPILRATMELGLCIAHHLKGEFDVALRWGKRAQRLGRTPIPYLTLGVEFQLGQIAFAQGHVRDAVYWYKRGSRMAKAALFREPRLQQLGDILLSEIDHERHGTGDVAKAVRTTKALCGNGMQFSYFAAASSVATELVQQEHGVDAALALVEEVLEHARGRRLPALARFQSALQVQLLAMAARTDEAELAWRQGALPQSATGCLDLSKQSWREMEAVTCARVLLLLQRGSHAKALCLVDRLVQLGEARGLRRTQMRGLALAMRVENLTGNRPGALTRMSAFLDLFADTDYGGSLAREAETATVVLEEYLTVAPRTPSAAAAEALLRSVRDRVAAVAPEFSKREIDVLERLERQSDKQIATALGLTTHGVRYHIRKIFGKLRVRNRRDAIRRARAIGSLASYE
ncbi:MAG: LuxR C-terminal-related transcriptional regulator [Gammaproteobacteria bacterium]|nr:LuxR C-terminal-related transcriptional regulator [Gammaproteobacteria bacterium]